MKIAIIGKMRSGKTYACNYIAEILGADVFEFSDAVKQVDSILYQNQVKNRDSLIAIGQHMRKLDKDIWVNVVKNKILNSGNRNIVVSSIRQQNEYEMLKELGFVFIKIECFEHLRIERCIENGDINFEGQLSTDLESHMDDFKSDYLITNNSSLTSFKKSLCEVMHKINVDNVRKDFLKDASEKIKSSFILQRSRVDE